ncbi:glycine zipper 2TM domain-containing protein [Bordetella genomosp. 13]|uniref:glycine zipper 2TM domain-containing protein n=1 Tax=Bordetella genomosp. 13 TaxID=463040 RepID=UPI0011AAF98A|nr:glycine zipper 2TM domain-containing protein [Bordetella genomosp. 13]
MNVSPSSPRQSEPRRGLHPLIATAAVSVIVLCAVAVAALAGWLPGSSADRAPAQQAAAQEPGQPPQPGAAQGPQQAAQGQPQSAQHPAQGKQPAAAPAQQAAACATCGTVEAVRTVQVPVRNNSNNIVGTVAGGVVGGVVGNQIGGGRGRDAATVIGAVGGALAGHEIERNIRSQQTVTHYELTVRMNDGSARSFRSAQPFPYASGAPVRVENNQVLPL